MVRSSHVQEALAAKDQELQTADLLYKLGQPEMHYFFWIMLKS